jgi:hypothetical protein
VTAYSIYNYQFKDDEMSVVGGEECIQVFGTRQQGKKQYEDQHADGRIISD